MCKVRATKFFSVAPDIFSLTATVHMHRAGGAVDCEVVRFTGHYSIYLLSICLSMCLSVCSSVCLPIYPSVPPSARPSIRLSFLCLSLSLSLSWFLSIFLPLRLCPSVRPPTSINRYVSVKYRIAVFMLLSSCSLTTGPYSLPRNSPQSAI